MLAVVNLTGSLRLQQPGPDVVTGFHEAYGNMTVLQDIEEAM